MRLVVLGDPVAHSRSPLLHEAALAELGLPGTYRPRRVDAAGLRQAVTELGDGRLDGANVTMPHKALAAELADVPSADVVRSGAANTLVRLGDGVAAHNTDVAGVRHAIHWAELPEDAPVLVLGGGGAAAAAVLAMEGRRVFVSTRTPERGDELLGRLGVSGKAVIWGEPVEGALVVNATPIGMRGDALPEPVLGAAGGLLDMAYGPATTPAVAEMTRRGLPVADGESMLLGQAVESFRLWTGGPAPRNAMRAALAETRSEAR